jgi:hypothetical protein
MPRTILNEYNEYAVTYVKLSHSDMDKSIPELIASTVTELGLPDPTNFFQTMLLREGYFVGWKFHYDGGHAIWWAGDDTIEFYGDDGKLLKTITLATGKGAAA